MVMEDVRKIMETGRIGRALSWANNKDALETEDSCMGIILDSCTVWAVTRRYEIKCALELLRSRSIDESDEHIQADKLESIINELDELKEKNLSITQELKDTYVEYMRATKEMVSNIGYNILTEKKALKIFITPDLLNNSIKIANESIEDSKALIVSTNLVNSIKHISTQLDTLSSLILYANSYIGGELAIMDMISNDDISESIRQHRANCIMQLLSKTDDLISDRIINKHNTRDMSVVLMGGVEGIEEVDKYFTTPNSIDGYITKPFERALGLLASLKLDALTTIYDDVDDDRVKRGIITFKLKIDMLLDLIALEGGVIENFINTVDAMINKED